MKIKQLLEFKFSIEYGCGTFSWYSPQYPYEIYATPYWEGQDGIAISASSDGEPVIEILVPFERGDRAWWDREVEQVSDTSQVYFDWLQTQEQFELYVEVLVKHLPEILTNINKKLYS